MREFLDKNHPEVYVYLPDPELELPKVPKEWFGNVCASVLEGKFASWVKQQIDQRHKKVASNGDLMIEMDQEMAEVFKNSTAISSKSENHFIRINSLFY